MHIKVTVIYIVRVESRVIVHNSAYVNKINVHIETLRKWKEQLHASLVSMRVSVCSVHTFVRCSVV